MPRFHFNICDNEGEIADEDGLEFPTAEDALVEGEKDARALLAEDIKAHRAVDHRRVEVKDADGKMVGQFLFRDLLH